MRVAENNSRQCWLAITGTGGAAFFAILATADQIEKFLIGKPIVWIIGGTFIAGCWAALRFCRGDTDT